MLKAKITDLILKKRIQCENEDCFSLGMEKCEDLIQHFFLVLLWENVKTFFILFFVSINIVKIKTECLTCINICASLNYEGFSFLSSIEK